MIADDMAVADDGVTTAPRARPSLYAAIKLARLVLFVKERFKAQIKSRRPPTEPSIICHRDSFQDRAFEDISHAIKNRSKCGSNFLQPRCNHKRGRDIELGLPTLLHDLDSHTLSGDEPMSMCAKTDELFLKFNAQRIATANSLDGVRHIFDLTTLMLERLCTSPGSNPARRRNNNSNNNCNSFKCDTFVANLEHLLLCLRQAAFDALIISAVKSIQSNILHWQQYWQQRQQTNEEWFAEWPNGQRPLNTTWPWNVKPSLVILWGVCWMFYDHGNNLFPTEKPRSDASENFRTRQLSQDLTLVPNVAEVTPQANTQNGYLDSDLNTPLSTNTATWNDSSLSTSSNLEDWQQLASIIPGFIELPAYSPATNEYIFISPAENSSLFPTQNPSSWPYFQGNPVSESAYQNPNSWPSNIGQQEPQALATTPRNIQRQGRVQPYGYIQNRPALIQESRNFEAGLSLEVPMRDYPSPHSDGSVQGTSYVSPGMQYPPSSAVESPENEGSIRSADLVKNDDGQLCCTHPDCARERPVFPRKCEYTKHMDKHNRPYVCEEPGCEKIQGFTYSGGLLRHQREVHRQHGGPKALCKCPHRDCKRSTGVGFSRKENLFEHLRRVHKPIDDGRDPIVDTTGPASATEVTAIPSPEGRKRRRVEDEGENESGDRDLQKQIKRLQKELQQKDDRLKRLEDMVEKLTQSHKPPL